MCTGTAYNMIHDQTSFNLIDWIQSGWEKVQFGMGICILTILHTYVLPFFITNEKWVLVSLKINFIEAISNIIYFTLAYWSINTFKEYPNQLSTVIYQHGFFNFNYTPLIRLVELNITLLSILVPTTRTVLLYGLIQVPLCSTTRT